MSLSTSAEAANPHRPAKNIIGLETSSPEVRLSERSAVEAALGALSVLETAVFVVEDSGMVVYANARAKEVVGVEDGDATIPFRKLWADPPEKVRATHSRLAGSSNWIPFMLTRRDPPHGDEPVFAMRGRALILGEEVPRRVVIIMGDAARTAPMRDLPGRVHQLNAEVDQHQQAQAFLRRLYEREQNLNRELIHRVKNNLSVLSSMLRMAARKATTGDPLAALDQFGRRYRVVVAIHDHLDYAQSLDRIRVDSTLERILGDIDATAGHKNVTITRDIAPVSVDMRDATPLGLLVEELVTNACTHGFKGRVAGKVHVRLWPLPGDLAELVVTDDGIGCDMASVRRGTGMRLAEGVTQQLGGKLDISRDRGMTVRITFPLAS